MSRGSGGLNLDAMLLAAALAGAGRPQRRRQQEPSFMDFLSSLDSSSESKGGMRVVDDDDDEDVEMPFEPVNIGDVFVVSTGPKGDSFLRLGEVVGFEGNNKGTACVRLVGDYGSISKTPVMNLFTTKVLNLGCVPKLKLLEYSDEKIRKARIEERKHRRLNPKRDTGAKSQLTAAELEEIDVNYFAKIVTNFAMEHILKRGVHDCTSMGTKMHAGIYGLHRTDFWDRVRDKANEKLRSLNLGWVLSHVGVYYDSLKQLRMDFMEIPITGDDEEDIHMNDVTGGAGKEGHEDEVD